MATVTYSSAGSGAWLCPVNVFSVTVACWGGGGGGHAGQASNAGAGGNAGGGGEYASDTVAVSPGTLYIWQVGTGGTPSAGGGRSMFLGGSVNVIAHGGGGGFAGSAGQGGTGSTNTTHFNGGNGGTGAVIGIFLAGGGGGSSGGTAANGNNGGNAIGGGAGAGGAAPTGGAAGGNGGTSAVAGSAGASPGAGGGGGGDVSAPGGNGAHGQVQLTYTLATQPLVPFFPAGYPALPGDFNNWIQSPLSFLTSKVVFRAELGTATVLASGGTTVLPFNTILEDPFAGWQGGTISQWLCPAGYTGTYEIAVTVSCLNNPGTLSLQALVGLDSAVTLYGLESATVPPVPSAGNGLASGAVPVQLYGGQDTVQGLAIVTGGSGTTVSTAGQRCELSIVWMSDLQEACAGRDLLQRPLDHHHRILRHHLPRVGHFRELDGFVVRQLPRRL